MFPSIIIYPQSSKEGVCDQGHYIKEHTKELRMADGLLNLFLETPGHA
jgi:hypothetical protein